MSENWKALDKKNKIKANKCRKKGVLPEPVQAHSGPGLVRGLGVFTGS